MYILISHGMSTNACYTHLFVCSLRDAVASMMENQPHVINNPVYLSALAASLFSGDGHEIQAVLEENNVRGRGDIMNDV